MPLLHRYLSETWEWGDEGWSRRTPPTSPPGRVVASIAYDSARQRTVLFGDQLSRGQPSARDTWEWDGQTWTKKNPVISPPGSLGHPMAYDPVRQRTMLVSVGQPAIETWEWDANWAQLRTATSPSRSGRSPLVWEWDGRDWQRIQPPTSPPGGGYLVYDSARQRSVLIDFDLASTWDWDGQTWTQATPVHVPPRRDNVAVVYHTVRQRTVLFGGIDGQRRIQGDTWEYASPRLTLTANTPTISIARGGTQRLDINAGSDLRNHLYWVTGSMSRTMPGLMLNSIHIPLQPDIYTDVVNRSLNTPTFSGFSGILGASGAATAILNVPANLPIPPGFKLHHAFAIFDFTRGRLVTSSNPVSVEFR